MLDTFQTEELNRLETLHREKQRQKQLVDEQLAADLERLSTRTQEPAPVPYSPPPQNQNYQPGFTGTLVTAVFIFHYLYNLAVLIYRFTMKKY